MFEAKIRQDGQDISLGRFANMETAALAKNADLSSSGTKYPILDGADYKVYCAAAVVAEVSFVR